MIVLECVEEVAILLALVDVILLVLVVVILFVQQLAETSVGEIV